MGAPLKAALDARRPEKAEGPILRNTFGEAWISDGFRASWGKAFDRAKLGDADIHFHDLRGYSGDAVGLVRMHNAADCRDHRSFAARRRRNPKSALSRWSGRLAEQAIVKLVAAFGS